MNQYPKWLLVLLAPCIISPAITMVFYLFGFMYFFTEPGKLDVGEWTLVLLLQLLWIVPLICFFLSLFLWGWMRETASKVTAVIGLVISIAALVGLFI